MLAARAFFISSALELGELGELMVELWAVSRFLKEKEVVAID